MLGEIGSNKAIVDFSLNQWLQYQKTKLQINKTQNQILVTTKALKTFSLHINSFKYGVKFFYQTFCHIAHFEDMREESSWKN